MTVLSILAMISLVVAGILTLARLIQGESVVDRIVALDTLVVIVVGGLAVHAGATGEGTYLEVMVVLALLGFAGTSLLARLVEGSDE